MRHLQPRALVPAFDVEALVRIGAIQYSLYLGVSHAISIFAGAFLLLLLLFFVEKAVKGGGGKNAKEHTLDTHTHTHTHTHAYLVTADFLRHVVERLDDAQAESLALLVFAHDDVFNVPH